MCPFAGNCIGSRRMMRQTLGLRTAGADGVEKICQRQQGSHPQCRHVWVRLPATAAGAEISARASCFHMPASQKAAGGHVSGSERPPRRMWCARDCHTGPPQREVDEKSTCGDLEVDWTKKRMWLQQPGMDQSQKHTLDGRCTIGRQRRHRLHVWWQRESHFASFLSTRYFALVS